MSNHIKPYQATSNKPYLRTHAEHKCSTRKVFKPAASSDLRRLVLSSETSLEEGFRLLIEVSELG